MPNVILGIHSKELVCFYHEELQYYISEESADGINETEIFHICYESELPEEEDSHYNRVNRMLRAREQQDDITLLELMEQYVKQELMIKACFHPME
jgi:argonaute-like protein implicated in RNA metabolism and viral defense